MQLYIHGQHADYEQAIEGLRLQINQYMTTWCGTKNITSIFPPCRQVCEDSAPDYDGHYTLHYREVPQYFYSKMAFVYILHISTRTHAFAEASLPNNVQHVKQKNIHSQSTLIAPQVAKKITHNTICQTTHDVLLYFPTAPRGRELRSSTQNFPPSLFFFRFEAQFQGPARECAVYYACAVCVGNTWCAQDETMKGQQ